MPTEATFIGEGHQWLVTGTDGLIYDHTDTEVGEPPAEGELWFLAEHRDKDKPLVILYSVEEGEVERA